jgi:cysteine synthase
MHLEPPPLVSSALNAVGSTPLVELQRVVPHGSARVLIKLEYFNPTGSYKDRMALAMIEEAEARGDLRSGVTVVEYSGGSTGSSLAFVCAIKGYRFRVVSSDAFAREKLMTMRAFGAEVHIVSSDNGRITPDLVPRMREEALRLAAEPDTYLTNQFHNRDVLRGYGQIGSELLRQAGEPVHAFCGGVGTAGMLMGVASALREGGSSARIVALEPASSPLLTTGSPGTHRVEGIGTGFIPPLYDPAYVDEVRTIDEQEGRAMARRLAREEGILAGISSGLNVAAAVQLARELGTNHIVVTVAVDTGLKYLAGDLFD